MDGRDERILEQLRDEFARPVRRCRDPEAAAAWLHQAGIEADDEGNVPHVAADVDWFLEQHPCLIGPALSPRGAGADQGARGTAYASERRQPPIRPKERAADVKANAYARAEIHRQKTRHGAAITTERTIDAR